MEKKSLTFNQYKTIFSFLQDPILYHKKPKKHKNSSKNSKSSRSKSKNSSSYNKIDLNKNNKKVPHLFTPSSKYKIRVHKEPNSL